MPALKNQYHLLKFLVTSALFFFIGTVHGVLQVIHPIRVWLDSIGSPYGGPGHMIDPLAHAHINVVGGVVIMLMAATYFMLTAISGRPVYSIRLVNHSYWWTTVGVCGFYTTLLVFGIWEGNLMLAGATAEQEQVHHMYSPIIAVVSTIMGIGFWVFFANVFLTVREIYKTRHDT
jgi:cytochrome c oxidase cbb3-type subunit 1